MWIDANLASFQRLLRPLLQKMDPKVGRGAFGSVTRRISGAELGMLLRNSPHKGAASYAEVLELAEAGLSTARDREARSEFTELVKKARALGPR